MGIVKRQSIKQSIVTYVGVVLGMANVLVIYPATLAREELGILHYVRETATMLSLFVFLGSTELIIRYFPHFKNEEKKHYGFLFFLLLIVGLGCLLLCLFFLLFKGNIYTFFAAKDDPGLYLQFVHYMLPFTVLIAFSNLFTIYASNFQRIVVPTLYNELLPKIALPLLAIAYFFHYIAFKVIFGAMLAVQALILLGTLLYLRQLGQLHLRPDFSFFEKPLLKEMGHYCLYGFFGSLGSRFSSEFISIFMVGTISTLTNSGVFAIAYFVGSVIDVPRRAISKIVSPLLAEKWKQGKLKEIEEIYHKSSLNQLIVGLWLFLAVWVSIDEIFKVMPNGADYATGKYVIFILGISRIVDMMTGVNSEIISFSKYYRYNFFLVLFMAAVHVSANFVLIPRMGLIGAALAILLSLLLFNLAKVVVLKRQLNMQPFSHATWKVLLISGVAYSITWCIPGTGIAMVDAGLKSVVLTLILGGLLWRLKVSPDVNQLAERALSKVVRFFRH